MDRKRAIGGELHPPAFSLQVILDVRREVVVVLDQQHGKWRRLVHSAAVFPVSGECQSLEGVAEAEEGRGAVVVGLDLSPAAGRVHFRAAGVMVAELEEGREAVVDRVEGSGD